MVTSLSSTWISLVRKSAPMVALYSLVNFFWTYWFMSEVLPTLRASAGRSGPTHPGLPAAGSSGGILTRCRPG
jgi:hypothetical protein